jgi:hypothetical protein
MPDIALFLRCASCGRKISAFLAFRKAGLLEGPRRPTLSDIAAIAPRLKCSQCGAKSVTLESEQYKHSERYWATSESENRVFHRSACTWMRSVGVDSEINFTSRQAEVLRGYTSCRACRP